MELLGNAQDFFNVGGDVAFLAVVPGDEYDFDLSSYDFSEDILAAYKAAVIELVLRQEASSPSVLDL